MARVLALLAVLGFLAAPTAAQTRSRCADCHVANPDAPGHLTEWEASPHGRNDVGCDRCHGGDPTTFERAQAHRGILPASVAASPVNRQNLPTTCGRCHIGPFVEFQRSRHYELLQSGDKRGPTCTTCHEAVAAHLLSPRTLARTCSSCHTASGPAPQGDFGAQAQSVTEKVAAVRADLNRANALIRRVEDKARRAALQQDYQQAAVPLVEAAESIHRFVFTELDDRLQLARKRTDALLDRLVNSPTR